MVYQISDIKDLFEGEAFSEYNWSLVYHKFSLDHLLLKSNNLYLFLPGSLRIFATSKLVFINLIIYRITLRLIGIWEILHL